MDLIGKLNIFAGDIQSSANNLQLKLNLIDISNESAQFAYDFKTNKMSPDCLGKRKIADITIIVRTSTHDTENSNFAKYRFIYPIQTEILFLK